MLLLLVASVVSWVVIVQRGRILSANKAAMLEFEEQFWSGVDLNDLYKDCQEKLNPSAIEAIFMAGLKELRKMRQQNITDAEDVMQAVQRALRVAITREVESLDEHLSFLATVGSTSPYIGLFEIGRASCRERV